MPFNIKKFIVSVERFIKHPHRTINERKLTKKGVDIKVYNEFNLKWLNEFNFDLILDIGAARGTYTIVFHELFPKAEIHSFEPLPLSYGKLKRNVAALAGIIIHNYALGRVEGKKILNISNMLDASSFLQMNEHHLANFPESNYMATEEVSIRTLDRFFNLSGKENIMIKMDTQGYEKEVIEGGRNVFSIASVAIVEVALKSLYVNAPTFDDLYSVMKELGYTFQGMMSQIVDKEDNSTLAADCIFVRSCHK